MSGTTGPDAVVIGSGPNGLVAANVLADAGWDVLVLEAAEHAGGTTRSDHSVHPDFVTDLFSAFHPLAAASPVLAGLDLHEYGLRWVRPAAAYAHVWPDDRSAAVWQDRHRTAADIDAFASGDGQAWLQLAERFDGIRDDLLSALMTPFPPLRSGLGLARRLGAAELLRFARLCVLPVRRFGDEEFAGEAGPLLFAGNALHADLGPEGAGSAIYGYLLTMLAQSVGFPVPEGGAGRIATALADRLGARGGQLRLSAPVESVVVAGGRALGVRLAGGEAIRARRAVVADVSAPALYRDLVGFDRLPARLIGDLARFQWDAATLKLNWALAAPIPWTVGPPHSAGTVHLGVDLNGLSTYAVDLAAHRLPREPFLLLGQMTTSDPTRSPDGTESAWAYTHLPEGTRLSTEELHEHVERMESIVERHAPGFRDSVLARTIQAPADLQAADANLRSGAVSGGTAAIHQELIFRPLPGLGRAETPIDRLYLSSASAHPGGGVHGGPGANAARAALFRDGAAGSLQRRIIDRIHRKLYC
ncbi:MAG: NAD(P)/FAD-dependent oxidoreductase [Actinobacteria bacterium]|nr:NAD(P)/FAD-dependent oxidoreductase [Actinomycetota bacterium]